MAVTAFSFIELLTTNLLHGAPPKVFEETLMVNGLKNMFVGRAVLLVNGMAIETAEVEAID
ncbi:hypothetical protein EHS17_16155 [Rhodobacteraceae bacterium CH30]|nr:hypothetical protein EHS17_16155 [Rhodobacteraceae bacterium CH30]